MPLDVDVSGHWPYIPTLSRLALALALGLFVGLEREWRGKEAGVRTFAFTALLGCLGGLTGEAYALVSLLLIGILVTFLNWQRLRTNGTAELTTSAALLVTGFVGILCGKGHSFTPVAVAVGAAALLAWKERLVGFAIGLSEVELRSAILLAILTFIIYPVLPPHAVDPWGFFEPRATWATVILIAGLGFINYLLWKLYGMRSIGLTGFLGGLVNSTVAVTELASRAREFGVPLAGIVYTGVLYSTIAMLLRNAVIMGIIAPRSLIASLLPMILMSGIGGALAFHRSRISLAGDSEAALPALQLESPFSLQAALKFGLIFLALHVAGTLAQRFAGSFGFYAVSFVGGLVSSASAVAAAASLSAHGDITANAGAYGAVVASLASVLVNLPLISRISGQRQLTLDLGRALGLMSVIGFVGMLIQSASL